MSTHRTVPCVSPVFPQSVGIVGLSVQGGGNPPPVCGYSVVSFEDRASSPIFRFSRKTLDFSARNLRWCFLEIVYGFVFLIKKLINKTPQSPLDSLRQLGKKPLYLYHLQKIQCLLSVSLMEKKDIKTQKIPCNILNCQKY